MKPHLIIVSLAYDAENQTLTTLPSSLVNAAGDDELENLIAAPF